MEAHFRLDIFKVLIGKWVAPIQALMVPNGRSTLGPRMRMRSGAQSAARAPVRDGLALPTLDSALLSVLHSDSSEIHVHFVVW